MNNKFILIAWLITYILFALLIFAEPIGYNPIWLSIFFFFVFVFLYLTVTNSFMLIFEKLPKTIKRFLHIFSTILELVFVFWTGWQIHKILNSGTSFSQNYFIIGFVVFLSIVTIWKGYRNLLKD